MIATLTCALMILLARCLPHPQWASKRLGTKFTSALQMQHTARVSTVPNTKEPSFIQRLSTATKNHHMVLRVFFVEFEQGGEPIMVLDGPMKVSGATVVCLMQALIVTLFFTVNMGDDPSLHTTSTSLIAGLLSSTLARPCLVACDQWFRFCAKVYQSRKPHGCAWNDLLYAGAALSVSMDIRDVQTAMQTWLNALDELRRIHLRSLRDPRFTELLKLEAPIPVSSLVHESFCSVTSAVKALRDWRDATIPLLRSSTSAALVRARDHTQLDLYARIARLELASAPETLRRLDGRALKRCAAAFQLIDKHNRGVLRRVEVLRACRHDPETRLLFGLPRDLRRDDGSQQIFDASMQALNVVGEQTVITYTVFKNVFTGLSNAAAIMTQGRTQPDSVSARLAARLGNASVERESQIGLFGMTPRHQQLDQEYAGAGVMDGPVTPRRTTTMSSVSSIEEFGSAASFLRTPGRRRSMHRSMALMAGNSPVIRSPDRKAPSPPPSPPLSPDAVTLSPDAVTLSVADAAASPLVTTINVARHHAIPAPRAPLVPLEVHPEEASASGVFGEQRVEDGPSASTTQGAVPTDTGPGNWQEPQLTLPAPALEVPTGVIEGSSVASTKRTVCVPGRSVPKMPHSGAVRLALAPVGGPSRAQPASQQQSSRAVVGVAPAGAGPAAVTISSPDDPALMTDVFGKPDQERPRRSRGPTWPETPQARKAESSHSTPSSVREHRIVIGSLAASRKSRMRGWPMFLKLLPWIVVGLVVLAAALINIVLTASIHDSFPYLLWPWYGSFSVSLVWTLFVQEFLIVLCVASARVGLAKKRGRADDTHTKVLKVLEGGREASHPDPPAALADNKISREPSRPEETPSSPLSDVNEEPAHEHDLPRKVSGDI